MSPLDVSSENTALPAQFDEYDRNILRLLNKDGRMTLKEIAKEVGVSIDTVKRRMDKMLEQGVMKIVAIPMTRLLGYPINAHVYLKFQNMTEEKMAAFDAYIKKHNRIMMYFSMAGEFDAYLVVYCKDMAEMDDIKTKLRAKFPDFIANWSETFVTKLHKYEEYTF